MEQRLQARLVQLEAELSVAERSLSDLDARRKDLRTNLLRIAGAISVLEDELSAGAPESKAEERLGAAAGARLAQLKAEIESGEELFADLTQHRGDLADVSLHLSGGIEVLTELLTGSPPSVSDAGSAVLG